MRVVVDLGCMERNGADSLAVLAVEYGPAMIFGFDPSPLLEEETKTIGNSVAVLSRKAAWLYDGAIGFREHGSGSSIGVGDAVLCFDFSAWLRELVADEIIVKMDIEGAEVELLKRMIADGTDSLVDELLVEWHTPDEAFVEELEAKLACKVRRWWL